MFAPPPPELPRYSAECNQCTCIMYYQSFVSLCSWKGNSKMSHPEMPGTVRWAILKCQDQITDSQSAYWWKVTLGKSPSFNFSLRTSCAWPKLETEWKSSTLVWRENLIPRKSCVYCSGPQNSWHRKWSNMNLSPSAQTCGVWASSVMFCK